MPQHFPGARRRLALAGGLAVVSALALSACSPASSGNDSSSPYSFTAAEQDPSGAASSVWQGWGYPSFSIEAAFSKVVLPAITAGKTVASVTDAWKTEMDNQAQVQGYTVAK
ncbi:hypothetical protein [Microbacterium testaceum]|uniref:hypothetical protein n=1 Tax=Microbacterium testaceum TaxID=2033 RepID=UPI0015E19449|nr:hypothetical protein [Microbacterium testaceum]